MNNKTTNQQKPAEKSNFKFNPILCSNIEEKESNLKKHSIMEEWEEGTVTFDEYENINLFKEIEFFSKDHIVEQKQEPFIIQEDFFIQKMWNLMVTISLFYILIMFPFELSEADMMERFWPFNHQINIAIEVFFVLDILLNFITTQRDKMDIQVCDRIKIAQNQITTWFFVDIISSIPVDLMTMAGLLSGEGFLAQNQLLRFLKLPKQVRVIRVLKNLRYNPFVYAIESILDQIGFIQLTYNLMNFFKTLMLLLIQVHLLSCLFISVTNQAKQRNQNWFYLQIVKDQDVCLEKVLQGKDPVPLILGTLCGNNLEEYQQHALDERKLLQLYSWQLSIQTVTTVGQGDMGTTNDMEMQLRFFGMLVGCIIYIFFTSTVTELVLVSSIQKSDDLSRKNFIDMIVDKYKLNKKSKDYLEMLLDGIQNTPLREELWFIEMLPPSFKNQVLVCIKDVQTERIKRLDCGDLTFFKEIQINMFQRKCAYHEDIQCREENAQSVFFIYSGFLSLYEPTMEKYDIVEYGQYKIFEMGECVGLGECMFQPKYLTSMKSFGMSDIVQLDQEKQKNVMMKQGNFQELMEQARKSIHRILEHNLAIQCLKLMLIVEGFQISNHDILSMSEEMFLNAHESSKITKLYLNMKNPKHTQDVNEEWYGKQLNKKLISWCKDKIDKVQQKLIDRHEYKDYLRAKEKRKKGLSSVQKKTYTRDTKDLSFFNKNTNEMIDQYDDILPNSESKKPVPLIVKRESTQSNKSNPDNNKQNKLISDENNTNWKNSQEKINNASNNVSNEFQNPNHKSSRHSSCSNQSDTNKSNVKPISIHQSNKSLELSAEDKKVRRLSQDEKIDLFKQFSKSTEPIGKKEYMTAKNYKNYDKQQQENLSFMSRKSLSRKELTSSQNIDNVIQKFAKKQQNEKGEEISSLQRSSNKEVSNSKKTFQSYDFDQDQRENNDK